MTTISVPTWDGDDDDEPTWPSEPDDHELPPSFPEILTAVRYAFWTLFVLWMLCSTIAAISNPHGGCQ